MENLSKDQCPAVGVEDLANIVVFKRYLDRFCKEEEKNHRRRLLYGEDDIED